MQWCGAVAVLEKGSRTWNACGFWKWLGGGEANTSNENKIMFTPKERNPRNIDQDDDDG